jgi:hypothetical protein
MTPPRSKAGWCRAPVECGPGGFYPGGGGSPSFLLAGRLKSVKEAGPLKPEKSGAPRPTGREHSPKPPAIR